MSNDLINKVNPIEIYSITADQRDYTTVGADGITLDDLGFGNFRVGYILPANITGGHTFHQDINFAAGVSGNIVNTVNGRTGAVQAVQTVSGYTASFTGFTGDIPGAVFSINGVTANPTGSMTLDYQAAITGDAGTIAAATGGAGGTFEKRINFFSSGADTNADQVAIRVRGTTADAGVGIGNLSPDGSYGLQLDSTLLNTAGGASAGGIHIKTDTNDSYNIMTDGQGAFGAGATLYIVHGHASSNASTVFRYAAGGGYTAPSGAMTDLFKIDTQGAVLTGTVKDKDGTPGTNGQLLVSNGSSKLSFASPQVAYNDISVVLAAGTEYKLLSNTPAVSSSASPSAWDGRLVRVVMTCRYIQNSNQSSSFNAYAGVDSSDTGAFGGSYNKVGEFYRYSGQDTQGTDTVTIVFDLLVPDGGSAWFKVDDFVQVNSLRADTYNWSTIG